MKIQKSQQEYLLSAENIDCISEYIQNFLQKLKMNEKNIQIAYSYDSDSSNIRFVVPLLKKNSQKTYSVNRSHSRLSENLLKFRSENIMIDVR